MPKKWEITPDTTSAPMSIGVLNALIQLAPKARIAKVEYKGGDDQFHVTYELGVIAIYAADGTLVSSEAVGYQNDLSEDTI